MANTIKLKRGSGSNPGASDLSVGELAIRTDEGKIFTKKDDGSVAEISGGGGGIATSSLTSFGVDAASSVTNGADNVVFGAYAGDAITTGSQNVCVGKNAGGAMVDGHWNVLIGKDCVSSGNPSGSVIIGLDAGTSSTGVNNVFIGKGTADIGSASNENCLVLGANADPSSTTVDNEITLGDTNITKFRIPGLNFSIKDSTATDNYVLTVDSNGDAGWESAPADSTKLPLAGGTLTGNLLFGDNVKAIFGAGSDLQIFHDGSDDRLRSTGNILLQPASGENGVAVNANGSVDLCFNGTKTAETVSGGFTVTGTCTATTFSGSGASLTTLSASNLTSGTVPDARFPATLPAMSGTNLTTLNASNLSSGTVATARLGSGSASSSTFLRGDGSWVSVSASPSGSNTQIQYNSSGSFAGSSNLTFDGTNLTVGGTVSANSAASSANGMRKVTSSTSSPSGGSDGDIWIKYTN